MTQTRNWFLRLLNTPAGSVFALFTLLAALMAPIAMHAQTGGEGAITGTVTDSTGAGIPNATVTATNTATNVATTRTTSGAGAYTIGPILPGLYSVSVSAKGFKSFRQDNLTVDALGTLGFNPGLTIGDATETIVVSAAPPVLDTTNATVGLVMENATYANLPIQMNNAERDATAFAALAPGAQGGTRIPIIGGTGNFLGQLYLDGLPAETINQQGDNRLVSEAVDLDAVDQFQVVTSTPPAEYSGAGSLNFTMKSGGTKYHGSVSDFVRNTIFDAWSFASKAATVKNAAGATVPAPKPVEHQNEFSATFGGHLPKTANKVFFFVAYDKYHERKGANPSTFTIPSTLMRTGDFTELNGGVGTGGLTGTDPKTNPALIFDPTSTVCTSSTTCTRQPFQAMKGGILTNNFIPASYISPIAKAMQSFLPDPTNPSVLLGNYLGGFPSGFDNHIIDWRVDFDLSAKQRLSTIGAMGAQHYLNNYSGGLPLPYTSGTIANIFPKVYDIEDTYTISQTLINQLKYGYTRFIQPQIAATDGKTQFEPLTLGLTNTPAGQASTEFPGANFATTGGAATTNLTGWTGNNGGVVTQAVTPDTFALLDNLQWNRGKHSVTVGFNYEWEEINTSAPSGFSSLVSLPYNSNSTAQFNGATLSGTSGLPYASFLLGAVGGSPSVTLQTVSEVGGRYHVASPYLEDNWKVSNKLTLDLGVRWDFFPPYHEVKDHWTFLNPTLTNSATGTPGELQFAGNYGGTGVSCGCRTPVQSYWKNFGPRVGLVYAVTEKTIFRAGIARVFSQAGGVGGRGGNSGGTGQTGFNVSAGSAPENIKGSTAGPSFYLNNGPTFTSLGLANTDLFGKNYMYPGAPTPNAAAQLLNSGNYLDQSGNLATARGVSFADPYFSGRAPEFTFWNAGIERSITRDMTLAINYVGDQSHYLSTGGNVRGYWANQLNPVYLAALGPATDTLGTTPLLDATATTANVIKAQSIMAGINIPTFYQNAANANPNNTALTIAQGLVAFPQYSGINDLWGSNTANLTYHSFQLEIQQRTAHGLSFNVNYTYSKNIGDDGSFRSGFDIPASALSGGGKSWHQDRIDRSWSTFSVPQIFHAFGVYQLPFGKDHIGGNSMLVRTLAGGWLVSGIYTYQSGTPIAVTSGICTTTNSNSGLANYPLQGQCMTDTGTGAQNARINGSYGSGPNGFNTCNLGLNAGCKPIAYIDQTNFSQPTNVSTVPGKPIYLIGNTARTQALNLRNPGTQNFDAAVHRNFALPHEWGTLVFEVDCINVTNKVTFNGPNSTWNAKINNANQITSYTGSFGQINGASGNARDFQFAAHFNF
jgi:hypothetical protein